jgi:hypothetical protein
MTEKLYSSISLKFAIIGAQRGGSTFLATLLDQLPEVDLPYLELPIFEDGFYGMAEVSEVERAYAPLDSKVVRGIKRPDLLGLPHTAHRLHDAGIERVIAVLRDPLDRLVSAAHWYMYSGLIPVETMDEYLLALHRRAVGGEFLDVEHELVEYSMFGRNLEGWLHVFDHERLMIIDDKDLKRDPRGTVESLARQIGITSPVHVAEARSKRNGNYYDPRRLRFMARRTPWIATWHDGRQFSLNRSGTRIGQPFYKRAISVGFHLVDRCIPWAKNGGTHRVPESTTQLWREFFADDQALVAKLMIENRNALVEVPAWS